MSGYYVTEMLDVLTDAGVKVKVTSVNAGWETRSRSSGGFPEVPLAVWWHHTASNTSPENDLNYMINGSPDAPVGNILLDRDGVVWPIAAGASNCAGKGGPMTFSRGTVAADTGNTRGFQCEAAGAGTTGHPWPAVQMDAYFAVSNAMNLHFGNQPTDVTTHFEWAPTRKIDPAVAADVQGSWRPSSCTSSGTWALDEIRAECKARATVITPVPPDGEELGMTFSGMWKMPDTTVYAVYMSAESPLGYKIWMKDTATREAFVQICKINGWRTDVQVQTDPHMFRAFGPVIGPNAAQVDAWGVHL